MWSSHSASPDLLPNLVEIDFVGPGFQPAAGFLPGVFRLDQVGSFFQVEI
jgi:hypothetical protein